VSWEPAHYIHAANCVRGVPAVFNPRDRPWVHVDATDADTIALVIETCPTGALHSAPLTDIVPSTASGQAGRAVAKRTKRTTLSQADAQAVLGSDPSDPNRLDQGGVPALPVRVPRTGSRFSFPEPMMTRLFALSRRYSFQPRS
jgi:uncharacterized Fe-S cluster protein YjdI